MRKTLAISAAACAMAAWSWQQRIDLPPPFHTPSSNNRPQVIERPDGARLVLPQGFSIEEYAAGFERPRFMVQARRDAVLLSDSIANGSVIALVDNDGDFKPEQRKVLVSGLDRPFGMAFWKEYLYIAETTSVKRYKFNRKSLNAGAAEEVVPMKDFGKGHWTRCVLFDRNGEKMYLGIGSGSNVDAGEPEQRAAISRYNPDGTAHELFATGTRNPVSMRFYPGTDTLWSTVQERDLLGDDLVPDYFTHIEKGGFYGWPYAYIGPNEDPRRKGERPELVKQALVPDLPLQAHTAVMDAWFYTGKHFPNEYQGGAFLALHGSWNRSKRVGYSVVFVPFKNGKPAGPPQDFLTGFMLDAEKREVWGRPVGLLELTDGSLLVSDDGGNKIWRIRYKG